MLIILMINYLFKKSPKCIIFHIIKVVEGLAVGMEPCEVVVSCYTLQNKMFENSWQLV